MRGQPCVRTTRDLPGPLQRRHPACETGVPGPRASLHLSQSPRASTVLGHKAGAVATWPTPQPPCPAQASGRLRAQLSHPLGRRSAVRGQSRAIRRLRRGPGGSRMTLEGDAPCPRTVRTRGCQPTQDTPAGPWLPPLGKAPREPQGQKPPEQRSDGEEALAVREWGEREAAPQPGATARSRPVLQAPGGGCLEGLPGWEAHEGSQCLPFSSGLF